MSDRFLWPASAGAVTLGTFVLLLFVADPWPGALVITAVGGPITVLLLVRAVADPGRTARSTIPSFILGATLVPFLVAALHAVFLAIGYALVQPFAAAGGSLLDELRADPVFKEILGSGWALVFLAELAVVAPLAEETLKPLGAILRRPGSRTEAFLFGVGAGAGFAAIENLLYASGWFWSFEGWLPISLIRLPGAALHSFGAGLVALGYWEFRHRSPQSRGLWRRYGTAVAAHALWNGSIAVTVILYSWHSGLGELSGSALAWGIALTVYLAALGAAVFASLLVMARRVARDVVADPLSGLVTLEQPGAVAAWAAVSALVMVPAAILVLVFPRYLAL